MYSLVLRFAPYVSFGNVSYINKYLPISMKDDNASAKIQTDTFSNINGLFVLMTVLSLLVSLFGAAVGEVVYLSYAVGLITVAVILLSTYFQSVARNTLQFDVYIKGVLIFVIMQLFLGWWMSIAWGVWGVYVAILISYLLSLWFYFKAFGGCLKFVVIPCFNLRPFRLGFPPFLLTISAFLLQASDRIALVVFGETQFLVNYGVCFLFYQLGVIVVNTVGKVVSPYFLSAQSDRAAATMLDWFAFAISCVSVMFIVFYSLFGGVFLSYLLPEYVELNSSIFIYVVVGFVMSIGQVYFNQLIKISRELYAVCVSLLFALLNFSLVYYFASLGSSFETLVYVSLLVNSIFSVVLMSSATFFARDSRVLLRRILMVFIPLAVFFVSGG